MLILYDVCIQLNSVTLLEKERRKRERGKWVKWKREKGVRDIERDGE